jgi:hypothetical protein
VAREFDSVQSSLRLNSPRRRTCQSPVNEEILIIEDDQVVANTSKQILGEGYQGRLLATRLGLNWSAFPTGCCAAGSDGPQADGHRTGEKIGSSRI